MSEAPDYLVEFTHEVAKLLERAGAASFERDSVAELARKGRDLEVAVLARAVRADLEHRVLPFGNRTVVFH